MPAYHPPPLEVIRERVEAARIVREAEYREAPQRKREREAAAAAERRRKANAKKPKKPRKGSPHSEATKAHLSEFVRKKRARQALSDPATNALRRARIHRGWTAKRAAAEVGIHRNTLRAAESGRHVSEETGRKLVAVFGPDVRPS